MSYNGSGTFVINSAGQPVVSGTVISSTAFNALTADLATGLSTAITKDGQTTITANIPMANYKFTGLGTGSAAGDSANLSQVQSTAVKLLASVSGADTITAVGSPNVAAYVAGQMFYFVAAAANTGAVTINIDSLGAKSITRDGTTALAAGDIQSGEVCVIVYDGTQFQLVNGASQSASIVTENLTVNKATVLNESGGDNDTRIEGDTDSNLLFVDASTDRVGVGTDTPKEKIDSRGAVVFSGDNATGTNAFGTAEGVLLSTASGVARITAVSNGNNNVDLAFRALNAGSAASSTLLLNSSGNLGLGVTPSAWGSTWKALQISSWASLGAETSSTGECTLLQNAYASGASTFNYIGSFAATRYTLENSAHKWFTAASGTAGDPISFTQAMSLTSGGNLLVGTTASSGKLSVQTSGNNTGVFSENTNTATTSNYLYWGYANAATRFIVYGNGGIANYSANNVNLSDERVKTDIAPLGSMWDKFKAIEIVTFKYKDQTHDDNNIGVIAQQVESVAPEFVDVDGWSKEPPEDGVPLKSIYTEDLHHAAIKALQEAMTRIEELEAKVAALEAK